MRSGFGPKGSLSHLLVTSSLWSVLLRVVGMALAFLLGVQLARYLGPAGFGIYGIVVAIVTVLSSAAQLGLYLLATREIAASKATSDWALLRGVLRWFAVTVGIAGTLLGGLLVLGVIILPGVTPEFRLTSLWAAPLVPVVALTLLVSAELRAFDRLIKGQAADILIRPAAMSLLLLALVGSGAAMSPRVAMATNLIASTFALAIAFYWLARATPVQVRQAAPARHIRKWVAAGLPLAMTELLRQVDGTYAVLVTGITTTAAETGIFRVASSSVAVIAIPMTILNVVLAPTLANYFAAGAKAQLQRLLSIAALITFGAMVLTLAALALFGQPVIVAVFGREYAGAWPPLMLLASAQGITAFFGVGVVLLAVSDGERDLLRAFVASVAASLLTAIPLGMALGANGVALAAVIGALINNLYAWRAARKRMGLETSVLGFAYARGAPRAPAGE
jgi:O-antigen/teichoic acid export membrane protein